MNGIKFTELIDVKVLQRMLDAFSEYTGMAALATDEKGVPVTKGSGFTQLCMNLVRKSEKGYRQCEECDRSGAIRTYESGRPVVYSCHTGLTDYAAPVMIGEDMIGCIIGGQVRTEPLKEEHERGVAKKLGIDEETYLAASRKINVVKEEQVCRAAKFLSELAAALSDMAYKNYVALQNSRKLEKVARSQTNYMVDMYTDVAGTVGVWTQNAQRLLQENDYEAMAAALNGFVRSSKEVLSLVRNSVEYARMTNGELALSETSYKLKTIMDEVAAMQSGILQEKGNRMEISVSDETPTYFFGDTGRLKQLAAMLVKIANDFTREGVIQVNAYVKKVDYADMLNLEVKDDGAGIVARNLTNLNRYMRHADVHLQNCTETNEKEFFILRMLLGQLSGKIVFESAQDAGTLVRVTIPQLEMK